ncbi:CotH kinase family protein [Geomicrobium sp. JCM 19055]|uniref:CotH kinase family protein n=1 Tax=Geomicrobium sp. JCM 19055 TaxID=1460649 RepID=UPI00045ED361|nr:CotH kinase family protein [Geomicrobium sp. JCM 19055]GAJ97518.1 hypothetical protein JCM19055_380 [Geomicrobium sp. JCM 19055]
MKVKHITILLTLIVIVGVAWGGAFIAAKSQDLTFEDQFLEQAIREDLHLEEGEGVTAELARSITSLDLSNQQIENLSGLEHFEMLNSLDLTNNKIEDISTLSEHERLETLSLEDNNVHEIDYLAELSSLTSLNLRENYVENIEPITELIYLEDLNLRENRITSIDSISGLEFLEDLNLRYNEITSIEPVLTLPLLRERLYVEGNPIEDLLTLTNLYDEIEDIDIPRPEYHVTFSQQGGVYQEPFVVEVDTLADADGILRYTVDGSEVTEDSPVYNESISINEGQTVRAKFFSDTGEEGPEDGQSYIVDESSHLPIISIATDEANLWDEEYGIYTPGIYYNPDAHNPHLTGNYHQSGQHWERPVFMQMFEPNGEIGLTQHAGIRIHGGASRSLDRKSLRFYARSDYGENRFRHPLFGEEERDYYNRFILRNSGQDWNRTLFRDAMMQSLVEDLNMETQLYRPAKLYVNGEDWGLFNIRERYDNHYFRFAHDVSVEDLDLLETHGDEVEGSNHDYMQLRSMMTTSDPSEPEVYEQIKKEIDIDNFIDYHISQIYFGNVDWPNNNVNIWRERPHGKWRWAMYDTDFGFALPTTASSAMHNTLEHATNEAAANSTFLLRSLLQNEEFEQEFINRYAHYLNTRFEADRVVERINEFHSALEPEMQNHIERWNEPDSLEEWEDQVDILRDFATNRQQFNRAHIAQHFALDGWSEMTVVNTHIDDWGLAGFDLSGAEDGDTGIYFTNTPISTEFNEEVHVQSSNDDVAQITSDNSILLVGEGEANVTISNVDGDSIVHLHFNTEHVEQDVEHVELGEGSITPTHNDTISWISSNDQIIAIEEDGTFEAQQYGAATLFGMDSSGDIVEIHHTHVKEIAEAGTTINPDAEGAVTFVGVWSEQTRDDETDHVMRYSQETAATATFSFIGTGFEWTSINDLPFGEASVYINGELHDTVQDDNSSFEVADLEEGQHVVTIVVDDVSENADDESYVSIDEITIN